MAPVRKFDTVTEDEPSAIPQEVDNSQNPQLHQQLTVHSRHHAPIVADLTNGQAFLNQPNGFGQM